MRLLPVIARDRLVNELTDPAPKLVKLIAPAGYGKSTLARALTEQVARSGVVDAGYVRSAIDVARSVIEALSAHVEPARREHIAEQCLVLGDDANAWERFAAECVASTEVDMLAFENAEALAGVDASLHMIEQLLRRAPAQLHTVVCSRVEPGLRLGRFAGPDRTRVVGADDLRFDRDDIAALFAGINLRHAELDMIEEFSRGWPIVVMMLYTIARRGRLAKYVQERQDSADLYGYLASEVYRFLSDDQRSVLEAAAAIPDARESDLTTLFGARTVPALEALESETPFVVRRPDGRIEVHPALREALADRTDSDVVLERLYTELDRSDGGVRAAQIALHRRRLDDAAAAIAGAAGPYLVSTPSAEVNHIISVIPEDVAYRYPALWSAVAVARGSRDIVAYIEAGERLFETLDSTTPPDVRIGLYSALTNCYLNRGRFKDAEVLARRFRETMEDEPVASMLISFWKTVLSTYRGQHLDVEAFRMDFAPLLAAAGTRSLCEYDIIGRSYRLHGDRREERAALERAVEIARSSGIPIIVAVAVCDAAFGAWLWGEDLLFEQHVAALDEVAVGVIRPGFFHFLESVRGRCASAPFGSEKLKTRSHAFLIAASLSRKDPERGFFARQAVLAADQSSHPYTQVLARLGLALCASDERDAQLNEAAASAAATCSEALRSAVDAVRKGDATGTMFEALVRRFEFHPKRVSGRVLIDIDAGSAAIEDCREPLRPREASLLAFLALSGRPVRRDEILEALWPDGDPESAAATFKTYVSRLRRLAGNPNIVVLEAARYRLGAAPVITRNTAGATGPSNWPWFTPDRSAVRIGSPEPI